MGALLESRLASWGVKGGLVRLAISFTLVAFLTLAITFAGTSLLGDLSFISDMNQFTLLGAAAGITFGAIFALFNYRAETIRQRIQLLELENRHLADLASREELLREAARNLAVAEERNRMARELHDSISQGVHGIVYSLRSLRAVLADNPRGREILGHLEETAADTLKELRRLVMELTPWRSGPEDACACTATSLPGASSWNWNWTWITGADSSPTRKSPSTASPRRP